MRGGSGSDDGQLNFAFGLAVDSTGSVCVVDSACQCEDPAVPSS